MRVWCSRRLGRWLTGEDRMLCATLFLRAHPAARLADFIFGRDHCKRCADWEEDQRTPGFVDDARRNGWL